MDSQRWHQRFLVQAEWTKELRRFLYPQLGINQQSRILEVGCGTGVITSEISEYTANMPVGIDIDFERLEVAANQYKTPSFGCADAYRLPFKQAEFDGIVTHYLFLWLRDPHAALAEILRVIKPGGFLAALAEPDYLARVDNPQELWKLGELQTQSMIRQGANPMMGRQLAELFSAAGLVDIQFGVSGFQSRSRDIPDWYESEWETLEHDLAPLTSLEEIKRYKESDLHARQSGSRVLWVPTFYAFGKMRNH